MSIIKTLIYERGVSTLWDTFKRNYYHLSVIGKGVVRHMKNKRKLLSFILVLSMTAGLFSNSYVYAYSDTESRDVSSEETADEAAAAYPAFNPEPVTIDVTDSAIIYEIKVRKKFNEMEDGLKEAYDQIRDKKYEEGILDDSYMGVKSYGICFCKKSCIVGKYNK